MYALEGGPLGLLEIPIATSARPVSTVVVCSRSPVANSWTHPEPAVVIETDCIDCQDSQRFHLGVYTPAQQELLRKWTVLSGFSVTATVMADLPISPFSPISPCSPWIPCSPCSPTEPRSPFAP